MKILFLCKYNVFRSRIAEEYFNKINKNKKNKAISRGFIIGEESDKSQKLIARKYGIILKDNPKPITLQELKDADKIIVVADDIPKIMFNYELIPIIKKVETWNIKDEQKKNRTRIEKTMKGIIKKVDKLVGNIK